MLYFEYRFCLNFGSDNRQILLNGKKIDALAMIFADIHHKFSRISLWFSVSSKVAKSKFNPLRSIMMPQTHYLYHYRLRTESVFWQEWLGPDIHAFAAIKQFIVLDLIFCIDLFLVH